MMFNLLIVYMNLKKLVKQRYSLGVLVDDNLNFQKHHKKLVSNLQLKLLHFRRIRRYLTKKKAAILVYKCTILPLMEYADFICDQGIAYVNKSTQKLQNMGLSIAFNQHILPYAQRDSSDLLHRQSKMVRLIHRRKLHLLQFAFTLKGDERLLDCRDIPTRCRDGFLFNITKSNHNKFPRNPYYRCMFEWNNLDVETTMLIDRELFRKTIKVSIKDPYTKVLL